MRQTTTSHHVVRYDCGSAVGVWIMIENMLVRKPARFSFETYNGACVEMRTCIAIELVTSEHNISAIGK